MSLWALRDREEVLAFPVCDDCLLEAMREFKGESLPGEEVTATKIELVAHRTSEDCCWCEKTVVPAPKVPPAPGPSLRFGNDFDFVEN